MHKTGPAPFDAAGLDCLGGMSAGDVEEFIRARAGESAHRPVIEQHPRDAVAAAESGGPAVAEDYQLAESDGAILAVPARPPHHLVRAKAAHNRGIDSCIDDEIAFTHR